VRDDPSSTVSVFRDRRQARGWLLGQWCIYAIAVVIWARLLLQLTGTGGDVVPSVLVTIALVALATVGAWSYRAARGIRPTLVASVRERELPWWQRDRFLVGQAAARLGWPVVLAVGVGRGLLLLALVLMVASLVVALGG
jgi:hypothetical protein